MAPYDIDSTNLDGTRRAAVGGWRSLLSNRLLLALLAVSLIPLALMGIATYRSASHALTAEAFAKLDARVLDHIAANSEEILGKKMSREVIAEGMYKSPIKPSAKEGYAPVLNLKCIVDPKSGSLVTSAYNAQREPVALNTLERGQALSAIIELNQIWRTPAGVGVSVRVHQVMFAPTSKLKPCAFLAPADEPISDKASDVASEIEYETDPDQE